MKSHSPRLSLLMIVALFTGPVFLAWLMNNGTIDFEPDRTRNLGELIDPPVPIQWSHLQRQTIENSTADNDERMEGSWVLVYVVPKPCAETCKALITNLRQVHRASGRNRERIRLALIVEPLHSRDELAEIHGIYPDFKLLSPGSPAFEQALKNAESHISLQMDKTSFYLVDPLGNIMMAYNGTEGPAHASKDLKRLLTWSKQDKRT